jgi:protein-L-isoaspartate O-methyltransferase
MDSDPIFRRLVRGLVCAAVLLMCLDPGVSQTLSSPQPAGEFVAGIYGLVSSSGGKLPDWDKVRSCFSKEAVIVLRTSRTSFTTFSVDGFIRDFTDFYEKPLRVGASDVVPRVSGFKERVVRMKAWEYGEMAHVLVLYEAQVTAPGAPVQRGLDSWLLIARDGKWSVAAITNEVVRAAHPLPPELRESSAAAPAATPHETQRLERETSLKAAEEALENTEREHVEALYTLARLHAEAGNRDLAYRFLARATAAGFNDRARLLEDDAFRTFREDELFRSQARRAWANGYISLLERANREEVQKSSELMKALAFKPGERVADIGAGSGYFTIPVAKAVGPAGVVHALDISSEMLEYLDFRVKAGKIANVRLGRVKADDPQLEPASVDTILMIDAMHYVKDRVAYAKKLRQGLAQGGRLVIVDYKPKPMSERPWGPPPEQQIPRERMDADMAAAGFAVSQAYDFMPEQYFVVYTPK